MKTKFTVLISFLIVSQIYAQQTVGLFHNDDGSLNGYTLISPLGSNQTYLIDNCGFIVNEWSSSQYNPGAATYLLEDGSLLRTANNRDSVMSAGGSGGILERYDWDDNLIWSYRISDERQRQHHDIEVLPNGNILVLTFDYRNYAEAIAAGRDTSLLTNSVWSEKVIELQPIGQDSAVILWEWYLWDHLVQDYDVNANNYGVIKNHPELINLNYNGFNGEDPDWIHANSLAYNPALDQIMISAKNYHEIWIIDHSTTTAEAATNTGGNAGKGGDILYRWGNPATYDAGDSSDQKFDGQHDAHWIPDGYTDAGKILLYNNRFDNPLQFSTVEIIEPPIDAGGNYAYQTDSAYLPLAPTWTYQPNAYSGIVSSVQRLENGNTLICSGRPGVIVEIDTNKQEVWKYVNPAGPDGSIITQGASPVNNLLFRANRYTPEYAAFSGKDLTPRVPIELNPIASNCQIYFPTATINKNWESLNIKVIGNPIFEELNIENYSNDEVRLRIVDVTGRIILEDITSNEILRYNTSNWAKGFYFLRAINQKNKTLYRQKLLKL